MLRRKHANPDKARGAGMIKVINDLRVLFLSKNWEPDNGWGMVASSIIERTMKFDFVWPVAKDTDDKSITADYIKGFDAVHILTDQDEKAMLRVDKLCRAAKRPLFITFQGSYAVRSFSTPDVFRWRRMMQSKNNTIICACKYTADRIVQQAPRCKPVIMKDGVTYDDILYDNTIISEGFKQESEHYWNCDKKNFTPFILAVSHIKPRKGYHIMLSAYDNLKTWIKEQEKINPNLYKRFKDIEFHIVGNPHDKRYYTQLLSATVSGVKYYQNLPVDKLKEKYRKCLFLASCAQKSGMLWFESFEGNNLPVLEAACAGKPSIACDCGGGAAHTLHHKTGIVVPEKVTAEEYCNAMKRMLMEGTRRTHWGRFAKEYAKGQDWHNYCQQMKRLYSSKVKR